MAKVLVLYYSSYGHIEKMAQAECQGARSAGAEVHIKRVPELVPHKVALSANYTLEQVAPVAQIDDLVDYDAVIFGSPTRFGNMAAQMKNFIDQAGGLWAKDRLVGKVGSVFTDAMRECLDLKLAAERMIYRNALFEGRRESISGRAALRHLDLRRTSAPMVVGPHIW